MNWKSIKSTFIKFIIPSLILTFLFLWQFIFRENSHIVAYFGRPIDFFVYLRSHFSLMLKCTLITSLEALVALFLSGFVAIVLLRFGLRSEKLLQKIERVTVLTQTVPMLVTITLVLILERALIKTILIYICCYFLA